MRLWRIALASALMTLVAADAGAFGFEIHVEMTRAALAAVLDTLSREAPAERAKLVTDGNVRVSGFSPTALQEIGDANKATDTDDCGAKGNDRVPARPCTSPTLGSQSLAAIDFLEWQPGYEHFDNESFLDASDLVFETKGRIREFLRRGNFVGARKALGRALHAIQDFYSHTNYVELGYRFPDIESRLGESKGSFARPGGKIRLAGQDEAMCSLGGDLFTTGLKAQLEKLLAEAEALERFSPVVTVRLAAAAKVSRILAEIRMVDEGLRRGPALTSGYYIDGDDTTRITIAHKCRHGKNPNANQAPELAWFDLDLPLTFLNQRGIHKDFQERSGHAEARRLANFHTIRFVVDLLKDEELRNDPNVDYVACILGFLGYGQRSIISRVTVGVPGAPNGASWDTATGSALRFFLEGTKGLKNIQPDILVCMESTHVPGTCAPICDDADWSLDTNAYVCNQAVGPSAFGMLYEKDLRVLVRETDSGEPRSLIASFRVEDPAACDPYCSLDLDQERKIWISFDLKPVTRYGGRYSATARTLPPRDRVPIATPSGGRVSPNPPSTSTGSPTSPAPAPSPAPPGALPPAGARALIPAAAARTPEGIDAALRLRDADNCAGTDAFFPAGDALGASTIGRRLGPDQTNRLYQATALLTAVTDPTAKQNLMTAITSRADGGDLIDLMNALGPVQGQAIVQGYQGTMKSFAGQVVSTGLTQLLTPARSPAALEAEVSRWIAKRLATAPLASEAVDRIFTGPTPVSAECTINELAKGGFTDAVNGL
jgi:hypothetical protein